MSGPINTGGPAFPHITESGKYVYEEGMTLRDYFAAKTMQGLLASTVRASLAEFARRSYEMADEMLKAREA